jgi:peptidyl-prolyl cis-trans isomerase C
MTMRRMRPFRWAASILALAGTSVAADPLAPAAGGAVVNGVVISEAAVDRQLQRVAPARRVESRGPILDNLIENVLLDQYLAQLPACAVKKEEIEKGVDELRTEVKAQGKDLADLLKFRQMSEAELREQIAAELRWTKYTAEQVSDAKLQALFDKEKELFDGTLVRASHILLTPKLDDPKEVEAATAELRKVKREVEAKAAEGAAKLPADADKLAREKKRRELLEEGFGAAAKEQSQCPSAKQGGDVEYFQRAGKMVEPFAKAAFGLQPGQMSDVVQTQFGLHLILVTDRKPGLEIKFADVKDDVKEELTGRIRDDLLAKLKPKATIKINPPPKP